jgi:hypothetical protein
MRMRDLPMSPPCLCAAIDHSGNSPCYASSSRARPPAGSPAGVTELEVEANNFRRLILELDRCFPGLGHQIDEGMAAAIDGEIY